MTEDPFDMAVDVLMSIAFKAHQLFGQWVNEVHRENMVTADVSHELAYYLT